MNKILTKLAAYFGYRLMPGHEYEKIVYAANSRKHNRPPDEISPEVQKKHLLENIKSPIIFDIGAYIGKTAEDYLSLFHDATVYAFEPTPITFTQLKNRFKHNDKVKCYNYAVTSNNGDVSLNINAFSPTNSVLPTDNRSGKYWGTGMLETREKITVKSKTLDSFCQNENISHIHLMKLDVQGAELQVLNGARMMLANKNISLIYLECLFTPTYEGQSNFHEIGSFLSEFGFTIYGIFNLTYDVYIKQADILFARESGE